MARKMDMVISCFYQRTAHTILSHSGTFSISASEHESTAQWTKWIFVSAETNKDMYQALALRIIT